MDIRQTVKAIVIAHVAGVDLLLLPWWELEDRGSGSLEINRPNVLLTALDFLSNWADEVCHAIRLGLLLPTDGVRLLG